MSNANLPNLLQRIEDLQERRNLSAWEADFLESLQMLVKSGRELSGRQIEVLEEMEGRG